MNQTSLLMRFILFFLLFFVGVCGKGMAKRLPKEIRDAIVNYPRMEVHRFAGVSPSNEDVARYSEQIYIEIWDFDQKTIHITPYVWTKDTTPIFIDSVTLKESPIKSFLDTLIKPVYDTLNHRPIYRNCDLFSVLQIDTVGNETIITWYKLDRLNPFHVKKSKEFHAAYTSIHSIPLLVYGNAVDLYFTKEGRIRMKNPYPRRAAIIKTAYLSVGQYSYKDGVVTPIEYDLSVYPNTYPYYYAGNE